MLVPQLGCGEEVPQAQWILLAELALMVQPKENPTVISY